MASARVVSVNTGAARDAEWAGRVKRTAIDKRPAAGPVRIGRLGAAGDEQADKAVHGGYDQALRARRQLGRDRAVGPGPVPGRRLIRHANSAR